ncbi:DUF2065 domain-containing protein [Vibrio sp. S17_S38]|uniref:DUF2065 domain-containing protein n=1 Tax=Vibrio sp. S17_S38 TaxID=2720229 RepID=UPI001680BEF9|nr:DUF2065 domain-containing protein [Vibrio sp. S17_S38]MBD1573217.1 DUF2065 domain-containing protein [Vibrio sp. S17_S38]
MGAVLIFEGLGPAFAPKAWKNMVTKMSQLPDNQLKRVGGALVVAGAVIVFMSLK